MTPREYAGRPGGGGSDLRRLGRGGRCRRIDADLAPVAAVAFVLHDTIDLRVNRIIPSKTNVAPWMNPGAELTHQNISRLHGLAGVYLNASVLARTVTTITRRALSLFMCHSSYTSASVGAVDGSCPVASPPI